MPVSYDLSDDETSQGSRFFSGRRPQPSRTNVGSPSAASTTLQGQSSGLTMSGARSGSVGLSDPSLSEARRRKLDAINRLQSLGAQRDIDIPQIVVIGSQSAGKSSLIESISGINLPRASGTCTRCPTECRLVHSTDPWQCIVSLRFTTDVSGALYEKARNVQFGAVVRNQKEVEDRLRRAQRAILNPSTDPQYFLDNDITTLDNVLNFSTNCVSLEIRGPEVTDLSFCDLPGLIASVADGGRDEDVEEVKTLVSDYIRKESCIILLTVACETDFETQGAYRLAKRYDPAGTRTIGVLTKPDRIPEGEHARWLRLITNESFVLQNGWYCVKQPSSADLDRGISFSDARRRGEDFFKALPWSRIDTRHRKHLGTQAVTQKLNEFLMDVITKRFPEIMQELQTMLQQTREQLKDLPAAPSNDPTLELMHLVNEFSDELSRQANGFSKVVSPTSGANEPRTSQFEAIRRVQEEFRTKIRATAPRFHPSPRSQANGYLDDEQVSEEPVYHREVDDVSSVPRELRFLIAEEGSFPPSSQVPICHDDVVERVQKATTRELPGYFPFHVVQELIASSTDQWEKPAFTLINAVYRIVVEHQNSLVKSYFGQYTGGGLHQTVANIMHEYMQKRREEVINRVNWLLKLESHAFTLNKPLFDDYKQKFLEYYQSRPEEYRPWNLDQSALEIMATVRAYFQVAYKRVVDTVPLAIDHELVRVQKRTLQEELHLGLKVMDPQAHEHRRKLLAEPADISALRDDLERRQERLLAAQKELLGI